MNVFLNEKQKNKIKHISAKIMGKILVICIESKFHKIITLKQIENRSTNNTNYSTGHKPVPTVLNTRNL